MERLTKFENGMAKLILDRNDAPIDKLDELITRVAMYEELGTVDEVKEYLAIATRVEEIKLSATMNAPEKRIDLSKLTYGELCRLLERGKLDN